MKRSGWFATIGGVLLVPGLVLQMTGSTDGGAGVPRIASVLVLLTGLVCVAIAGVLGLRQRNLAPTLPAAVAPQDRRERGRAFFVRLMLLGLVLVPLSLVIAAVAGNGTSIFLFAPPALVAVILAVVVRITGRAFLPALVISVLLFLFFSMLSQSELSHPESFADFVPASWRLVGSAIAVVGAFVAMRQRRKGTLRRATARERLAVRIGVLALIVLSAGSFIVDQTSRTTIARADGAIVVNSLRDSFDPDTIDVDKGRVRFLVRNDDSYAHTFSIDEVELDQYISPRSDRFVTVTFGRRGTYELYCAVTGHEDMTGTIEVD